MNLGLIKIYRRIYSIRDMFRYFFLNIYASFLVTIRNTEITYIPGIVNDKNGEIVFIGEATKEIFLNTDKVKQINEQFGNPEAIVYFSESQLVDITNCSNAYCVQEDCSIIDLGEIKIGCAVFNLEKLQKIDRLPRDIFLKKRILLKNKANFFVAYIKKGNIEATNLGKLKKLVGRWGFDIVIGLDNRIKNKKSFRTIGFGETRILYSLGGNLKKQNRTSYTSYLRHSVAYKVLLKRKKNNFKIAKEGYLPLCAYFNGNLLDKIEVIDKSDIYQNKKKEKYYLHIEKVMKGSRNWNEMITLSDIFDVLNIDIPIKYKHLSEYSINQICARTFELAPGNIFFFRQQFNDKNDIKQQNEFFRLRLALRAFIRRSLFVFSYRKLPFFIPHVVIDDPMEAHINVMAWYKKKFVPAKFVGVTGSIGKTSTKDMIYCALNEGYRTNKNIRNTNVQVKIGMNLQRVPTDCQIYVQEIGGGRPGGASRHSRMVLPDVTVITNIGTAHIGNYDSQVDLMNNKLQIIDGMPQNGVLFLNGDDELLYNAKPKCKTIYFAVRNKNADYYAENIIEKNNQTVFNIIHGENRVQMKINVIGEYNVLNAVCAYAISRTFKIKDGNIKYGLNKFKTTGVRQNIIRIGGFTFFMDCYNASLESVNTSMDVIEKLMPKKSKRRIAIIGDITGAGDIQEEVNKRVADIILSHQLDCVVLYGKEAEDIRNYLIKYEYKKEFICIRNQNMLEAWMENNIMRGDVILFKGSSKLKLDEIVDNVYGLNTADERYIDEAEYLRFSKNEMNYRIFHNYASLKKYTGNQNVVRMKKKIAGKSIKKIWRNAFANNQSIKFVRIGREVKHIGSNAFSDCKKLIEINISQNTRFIGKEAFSGCTNLKKVIFSGELLFLGKDAFKDCSSLEEIVLPYDASEEMKKKFKNINVKKTYY